MKPDLSPLEIEVLRLTTLGCDEPEIAVILKLPINIVKNYKVRVKNALGVKRDVLVTRVALKYGFTSLSEKLTPAEKRQCGKKFDGWNYYY